MSKTLRIYLCCIIYGLPAVIYAQTASPPAYDFYGSYDSFNFGLADKHYQGVLFPEAYKNQPSVRVRYPGLWIPDHNVVAGGLLPDRFTGENASSVGWNGLYGWADIYSVTGSMGLWVGNFNLGNSNHINEYFDVVQRWDTDALSLRAALWAAPPEGNVLRGASAVVDINNRYAYNGNEYSGLTNITEFYINFNVLIRLGGERNLRFGVNTYNRYAEDPADGRFDNRRYFKDGIYLGYIDDKLRTLELRVENTFAVNYGDEKFDTASVSLRYTRGRAFSYRRHMLLLGIKADVGASFMPNIDQDANSLQYLHYLENLTSEGWILRTALTVPIILDVELFRSVRGMLSISPRINYMRVAPMRDVTDFPYSPAENAMYLNPQHRLSLNMPEAELSFRGMTGDRIEFSVKPTLSNGVFISALEIKYKL